jgi:succinyl-CoA synthetase beta subunit
LFIKLDSTQVEINPWAVTPDGDLYCVDAKINIDDNAMFRHQDLLEMKNKTAAAEEVDPNELKAHELGLNYIGLDGNIGCMVNGAGLAMATMDIIKLKGEEPANFLDIGGGADEESVSAAFQILNDHPSVEAILINIFGGIVKCDLIAKEIIKATKRVKVEVPIVMRLTGTNSDEGKCNVNLSSKNHGRVHQIRFRSQSYNGTQSRPSRDYDRCFSQKAMILIYMTLLTN